MRRICGQPGVRIVFLIPTHKFIGLHIRMATKTDLLFPGKIINEWDSSGKKRLPRVKVSCWCFYFSFTESVNNGVCLVLLN